MNVVELRSGLLRTLEQISELAERGRERYDAVAHMLPDEISDDRVWFETVEGAQRLLADVIDQP